MTHEVEIEAHELNGEMILGHTDPRCPLEALDKAEAMVEVSEYGDGDIVAVAEIDAENHNLIGMRVRAPDGGDTNDEKRFVTDGGRDTTCGAGLT